MTRARERVRVRELEPNCHGVPTGVELSLDVPGITWLQPALFHSVIAGDVWNRSVATGANRCHLCPGDVAAGSAASVWRRLPSTRSGRGPSKTRPCLELSRMALEQAGFVRVGSPKEFRH